MKQIKLQTIIANTEEEAKDKLRDVVAQAVVEDFIPTINVTVEHDADVENPYGERERWEFISFGRRHGNYQHPDEVHNLSKLINEGKAFYLSFYAHGPGTDTWSLQGQGPQCAFDSVDTAGVLLFHDDGSAPLPEDEEELEKLLHSITSDYNGWLQGYYAGYTVECEELSLHESCWGFPVHTDDGQKYLAQQITAALPEGGEYDLNITTEDYLCEEHHIDEAVKARKENASD